MTVRISTYGGTLVSILVNDRMGTPRDVVLGYDTFPEYYAAGDYFSVTVGRYANRIRRGQFSLLGKSYQLTINDGKNHLHGGLSGFSFQLFDASVEGETLVLSYLSPDGEDGYPGNFHVTVRFTVTADNVLRIEYHGETDQPTVGNLTNHVYFNLGGGTRDVLGHVLRMEADEYIETDNSLLPTKIVKVEGTVYDYRQAAAIRNLDYDRCYILRKDGEKPRVELFDPESGIRLTCETDLPGVQLYTSGVLGDRHGRNGTEYHRGWGVCLETELFPDSPNHPEFPSTVVTKDKPLDSWTEYRFSCGEA